MWTRTRTYVTPPSRWRWSACALRTGVGIGRCPPKRAPHHTLTTALQQQQCSVSERGFLYNRFQEERGGREGWDLRAHVPCVCVWGWASGFLLPGRSRIGRRTKREQVTQVGASCPALMMWAPSSVLHTSDFNSSFAIFTGNFANRILIQLCC